MISITPRITFLLIFLCCAALLGFGLYLQHSEGLEPCPLCIFQRYVFVAIGLIAAAAALHGPKQIGTRAYGIGVALFALTGIGLAGRHVWLEHAPKDQLPSCGPGLDFILDSFPLSKALPMIFKGSGECAEVQWRFLGFSISEWTLVWFVLFLGMGTWLLIRKVNSKPL